MNLEGVTLTPGDYEQLLGFIRDRKLAYQPFRFDAEHEVGEGMAFLAGTSTAQRKGVVSWPNAPADIADLVVAPEQIAAFQSANQDLRRIYEHFLAIIRAGFQNDLAGIEFAEFGCNTGYFVHSLSQHGARRSIGLDFTYNQEVFDFFNVKMNTNSEFMFSEWDSFDHSPRYNQVPEVDVCLSVAVLCHLADPLHHLTYLCSRARKAVFVWTPSHDRDDLSMSFGTPSAFNNSLAWPVSFDNLVKPSRGLIELCLRECGFEDLQHVQPIRTCFDEISFWDHHTGILAKRTRGAATAYTGGALRRPLPWGIPDTIALDGETLPPQLVATVKQQNIVCFKGVFYTVPHRLGELDVAEAVKLGVAEVVPWPSLAAAREAAEQSDLPVQAKPIYDGQSHTFGDFDCEALRLTLEEIRIERPTIVEVGSWLGTGSTRVLIDFVRNRGGRLHCVDTWEGSPGVDSHAKIASNYDVYETFRHNVRVAGGESIVTSHRLTSTQAAANWPDVAVDMVFIDADHRFASVKEDIAAWLPKLRRGGMMAGHDCECRVTAANCARLDRGKDQDHIDCEPPFLVCHAGVIVAVDAAFSGRARLWAERLVALPDGRQGPATIWHITV